MKLSIKLTASLSLTLVALACSSSKDPSPAADDAGSCSLLASRCHGIDTPIGKECHELGHDGDDAKCGPRKAECVAACPERGDGGHGGDPSDAGATPEAGDSTDASPDGPVELCRVYCDCMKAACANTFADDATCMSKCGGFSADDLTCFAQHCEDAKDAADPKHDCEHASGEVACH